jgi:hypothetical protein
MSYSACFNTASIELGCAANVGGLSKIYVVAGSITGTTYDADGALTAATGTGNIYTFHLQKQTSSMVETFQISLENGTTYFEQAVNAVFNKMDQDKRNQLKLLSRNRQIVLFAEDNNGTFWYLGSDFNGGYLSAGSGESGTAFGDRNGYSVTITTYSSEPATTLVTPTGSLSDVVTGLTIND